MSPARVLVVHNAYQQRGGEDAVVEAEVQLLRDKGHEVVEYRRSNDELAAVGRLQAVADMVWSRRSEQEVAALIAQHRIQLVHVHNTLARISPSVYAAAGRAGVPVVQTLHNFRLVCPQALMLRNERPCEDCVGHLPWAAVRHACYRDSHAQSAALAGMLVLHRALGTWQRRVARFIALSEFARDRFVAGGLPAERLVVKPNFVPAGPAPDSSAPREGLLFVGRLSAEKGVGVLAALARHLNGALPIRVIGDGPLRDQLHGLPGLSLLGAQPAEGVLRAMHRARLLLLPSLCYENFPRTLAEALASGLPVLASRLGSLQELVRDGVDGWHAPAGDALAWAEAALRLHADAAACGAAGRAARQRYERELTPEAGYAQLSAIYAAAQAATPGLT